MADLRPIVVAAAVCLALAGFKHCILQTRKKPISQPIQPMQCNRGQHLGPPQGKNIP